MQKSNQPKSKSLNINYIVTILNCLPIVRLINYCFGVLDLTSIVASIITIKNKRISILSSILMLIASLLSFIKIVMIYISLPTFISKLILLFNGQQINKDIILGGHTGNLLLLSSGILSFVIRIISIVIASSQINFKKETD